MKLPSWTTSRENRLAVLTLVILVILPVLSSNAIRLQEYEYIIALALVAVGLNVAAGFAGQLALGPGGIFGIAGYTVAILANDHPKALGLVLLCLIGVAAASVTGVLIGVPALRVGGFYLGMATLAVAAMVPALAGVLPITGASTGISLLSNLNFYPMTGVGLYEICVAVLAVVVFASWALLHSRVGQRFQALANSSDLAASLGIVGYRTKLLALVISAWPAGLGAALYVYSQAFFVPDSASTNLSIYVLAACVIGGFGSVMGPIFGSLIVFGINEFLGSLQAWQDIVFGLLLAGFAILAPEGVMGMIDGTTLRRGVPDALNLRKALSTRRVSADHGETGRRPAPRKPSEVRPVTATAATSAELPAARAAGDLVLRKISRSFGGVQAVREVDLVVRAGTVHALIGSNGSGKTTVLNLISGFYRVGGGEIEFAGHRLDTQSASAVARSGVARTFQAPKLILRQTLLENVQAAAAMNAGGSDVSSILRLPSGIRAARKARAIARDAIREVGLDDYRDMRVSRLPHGLRRLGEVARSLAMAPGLLLLDEPAAGLTHSELELLSQVIRRTADRGTAVLLVEHNVPFVFHLADEVTVLHLGQVIAHGTPDQIRSDQAVAKAFLGSQVDLLEEIAEQTGGLEPQHG